MQNNNVRERENNHHSSSGNHPHSMMMNMRDKEKYIENFNFPYCDLTTKYEKITKIGQGTFG